MPTEVLPQPDELTDIDKPTLRQQCTSLRNYTRWRQAAPGRLLADILGSPVGIEVDTDARKVLLGGVGLSPDEARLIGVRLIDAAVLADGDRTIRAAVLENQTETGVSR